MSMMDAILEYNKTFVEEKKYEQFQTTKFPNKKLVILTCMDTRLMELLPRALNLSNGDAKIIKNAGAVISHPFGSIMRSIIVSLYELQAQEVAIIGHYDCGMTGLQSKTILEKAKAHDLDMSNIEVAKYTGIDIDSWLKGFDSVEDNIRNSVDIVRRHPLLPKNTPVHGLAICPETGRLTVIDMEE
ncbi:beta-class carbonic anhydrase [Alteribacillus iranensis]|uniref:carbonic anhydrase n=1 Tax=Alteribacillus iranensis TaxID=930128 RepID=A0A1I2EQG5_9BACI|nr:carbonic anhydrase [Alteribacillus iranensis]SFE95282.1 carbonic anhydrase [Alteribacillus iranensis]